MSLNSVNTNVGAMIALQSLSSINRELSGTLRRISTGLAISSPKDNPAVWAIAQTQRAESRSLDAVRDSLQRGRSITDVALSAGETVVDLLGKMKEKMLAAADTSLSTSSRVALNNDYLSLKRQIDLTVGNAEFGGVNLISSGSVGQIRALANADASDTVDIDHVDLSTTGAALGGMPADLLAAPITGIEIKAMSAAMENVTSALARPGHRLVRAGKPPDLHRQASGHPGHLDRPTGRRRHGAGVDQASGPADQAAAGHQVPGHRQFRRLVPADAVWPLRPRALSDLMASSRSGEKGSKSKV